MVAVTPVVAIAPIIAVTPVISISAVAAFVPRVIMVVALVGAIGVTVRRRYDTACEQTDQAGEAAEASEVSDG